MFSRLNKSWFTFDFLFQNSFYLLFSCWCHFLRCLAVPLCECYTALSVAHHTEKSICSRLPPSILSRPSLVITPRQIFLTDEQQEDLDWPGQIGPPPRPALRKKPHCVTLDPEQVGPRIAGGRKMTLWVINGEGFIPSSQQSAGWDLFGNYRAVMARHSHQHSKYHWVLNQHKLPGGETVCF